MFLQSAEPTAEREDLLHVPEARHVKGPTTRKGEAAEESHRDPVPVLRRADSDEGSEYFQLVDVLIELIDVVRFWVEAKLLQVSGYSTRHCQLECCVAISIIRRVVTDIAHTAARIGAGPNAETDCLLVPVSDGSTQSDVQRA